MDHKELMHEIRRIAKNLAGNVHEAKEYAEKAHRYRDVCKMQADWYRDMAAKHLEFNLSGRQLFDKFMRDLAENPEAAQHLLGIRMAYEDWMRDIDEDTAKVQAMLAMYK
ncbi:MAG: hypothetical protein J6M10_10325 [Clostridia bacterium]|nr:hypothetical protein [Clostridia bacterium]